MPETELMIRNAGEQSGPAKILDVRWMSRIEEHPCWPVLAKLPAMVTAEIPLKRFCVRDLLSLEKGHVVDTSSPETEDVPLMANRVQLAWSEFEVIDRQLVARLTRLA
jgi:flagellar motor switch/type III secretory pathway protein FliN